MTTNNEFVYRLEHSETLQGPYRDRKWESYAQDRTARLLLTNMGSMPILTTLPEVAGRLRDPCVKFGYDKESSIRRLIEGCDELFLLGFQIIKMRAEVIYRHVEDGQVVFIDPRISDIDYPFERLQLSLSTQFLLKLKRHRRSIARDDAAAMG